MPLCLISGSECCLSSTVVNNSDDCYCTLTCSTTHTHILTETRTKSWYTDIALDNISSLLPSEVEAHTETHTSPTSAQHLCSSPIQPKQRWSLWSQQPLRGALGYSPSICTIPFDSNEPISSKSLGAILWNGREMFSSHCNSNCSCSQLPSILSALIPSLLPQHTHYIWWNQH